MEGSKLRFNGHTEGFFIGRFVFESGSGVNVTRESVRYHNFITAIFVRIFGSGIIDITTKQGTIIHLNKGSVEKLVNKSSETDDDYLPDYLQKLKKFLVPSREEGSSSSQKTPPNMLTDANELYQKGQSYFNNQNTENRESSPKIDYINLPHEEWQKEKSKIQNSLVNARASLENVEKAEKEAREKAESYIAAKTKQFEEYKQNIEKIVQEERTKLEKVEPAFLELELTKENAADQIQLFRNALPKSAEPLLFDEEYWEGPKIPNLPYDLMQKVNFSTQATMFFVQKQYELIRMKKSLQVDMPAKLARLKNAARFLQSSQEEMAKQEAEKYPNDPMFEKLFKLFDITL